MTDKYILDGHNPVPATIDEWAKWYETSGDARRVGLDMLPNCKVSTVFLALDHSFSNGRGLPILFETMVFGGPLDGEQERYSFWDEAEAGHKAMVERVKAAKP